MKKKEVIIRTKLIKKGRVDIGERIAYMQNNFLKSNNKI